MLPAKSACSASPIGPSGEIAYLGLAVPVAEGVNLAAIEEIRLLKARYLRALDTKDWPLLRSL